MTLYTCLGCWFVSELPPGIPTMTDGRVHCPICMMPTKHQPTKIGRIPP